MSYSVFLHPDAIKYLDSVEDMEKRRCYDSLKRLEEDPHIPRSGCDIKKLRGKKKTAYRLRIGDHRFLYVIKSKEVFVEEAFKRGKGYSR